MAIGMNGSGCVIYRTANLPATNSYTICMWFKRRAYRASAWQYALTLENATSSASAYHLFGWTNGQVLRCENNSSYREYAADISDNVWYYICMRADGTNHQVGRAQLADVSLDLTAAGMAPSSFTPAVIYVGDDSSDEYVNGCFAYLRVWNVTLTDAEVLAERNSATAVKATGLLIDSPLTDNSHIQDNSGHGYNWTANGTITTETDPPLSAGASGTLTKTLDGATSVAAGTTSQEDQEGFRWRNDDGSEATATWKAAQDTATNVAVATPIRLRVLVNSVNDVGSAAYQLECRQGSGAWVKVA